MIMGNDFLKNMPPEMILNIFEKLSVKDAIELSKTSKFYQNILNNNEELWKYYFDRNFPLVAWPKDKQYKIAYLEQISCELRSEIKKLTKVISFILRPYSHV